MEGKLKITAFNGSPRGLGSATHIMVEEFLAGAKETGADVENIPLVKREIKHCLGCFACWVKTPGSCVQEDDMAELIDKFISSDVIILATPLYVDNVTGIMKKFIDRLIPILDPHIEIDEQGETRHGKRYDKYPKFVVISNCGFPEQSQFQVLRLLFQRIARNMHTEVVTEIYRETGSIIRFQPPPLQPFIDGYKKLLRKAGSEFATDLRLSEKTISALEKPLIPKEQFIEHANKAWDRQLAESGN
jgi:multimeric flavodoxin WrbA